MSSNIENINYSEFNNICRLCMFNCDVKFYLDCVVSSILHKLTDLHFETNDDLPKQICGKCFEKINEIQDFIFKCIQTHDTLTECLNNFKQVQIKQEVIENTDLQEASSNLTEEITIEEHIIEFVKAECVFDEKSEINTDQNIIEPDDDLLTSIKSNINSGSDEDPNYNYKSSDDSIQSSDENSDENLNISKNSNEPNILKSKCKNETFRRKHSGERSVKCDQCLKSFVNLHVLKSHMLTHTGERPFQCDQCSKSFTQFGTMKRHMRSHTGERPFKCDQCSKSFKELSNMKKHMRSHSGERPFKCNQCTKSFMRKDDLIKHLLTHTGERPFKCDQCSKSFVYKSNMTAHMRTVHKSNK